MNFWLISFSYCRILSRPYLSKNNFSIFILIGKWILSESYINESYKHNQWLDKRPYEWSSLDIRKNSSNKDCSDYQEKGKCNSHHKKVPLITGMLSLCSKTKEEKRALKGDLLLLHVYLRDYMVICYIRKKNISLI